jgi:hypothetical protein
MNNTFDENPFDLTKSSDFTDLQIDQYWVDIADGEKGLLNLIQPKSIMPMLLLGSKGCGKTHLMRYCSAPVQIIRNTDIITAIKNEKYLGVYVRADALNAGRFFGKGQDDETWYSVFAYYFEIWLVLNLLDLLKLIKLNDDEEHNLIKNINYLFNIQGLDNIDNLHLLTQYLDSLRKNIDNAVNNCAITRELKKIDFVFSPGDLLFGIPRKLEETICIFKNVIIVYLIDEVENFNEMQQKFLNTIIRYKKGNTGIKIGARLYGIKTNQTYPSGEIIKEGSEFSKIELDKFLRLNKKYKEFLKKLIIKRLKITGHKNFDRNINLLDQYFEEIETTNYFKKVSLEIVSSSDKKKSERYYFQDFKKNLSIYTNSKQINKIVDTLRIQEFPLLEKFNIYIFYKEFTGSMDLLLLAEKIRDITYKIVNGKTDGIYKYYQVYLHFYNDLLAQLYRDYKKTIPYAGLETIIHLSQGTPRNALGILKNIYRRSIFNGESPFISGKITIKSQSEGINDTANWFWDDAQPDKNGVFVRMAVENLAIFFRNIRYSNKPTECNLCSFSVDINNLSKKTSNMLKNAENWSYVLRLPNGRNNKNNQRISESYQLAPILVPKWGLSQKLGGTIEISKEFAEAIFSGTKEDYDGELKKRLRTISFEYNKNKIKRQIILEDNGQKELFDEI